MSSSIRSSSDWASSSSKEPLATRPRTKLRWAAIESDLGALVAFFDLVVMRRQFPAFNYGDTFDRDMEGDALGELVNAGDDQNDKVLVHVDVEYHPYHEAKGAALAALGEQMASGPFVSREVAPDILAATSAVRYEWAPGLELLDAEFRDDAERQVARFLLGQLVFSAYAQQTGALHVLAPRRSRLVAAVGLGNPRADESAESAIFDELRRRSKDAGAEWRIAEEPWRPSFLPLLVHRARDRRYKTGPDALLMDAKSIRESRAMDRYRQISRQLATSDADQAKLGDELRGAANDVARALDASVDVLTVLKDFVVDAVPASGGKAAGAVAGGLAGGPVGAALGASGGLIAERALRRTQTRLFGLVLDGLTTRRARKLLTRAVLSEFALRDRLAGELRIIWETPRAGARFSSGR
ncbi:MAG: hypothetical protein R2705_21620 [Ilumatobacteraceae bacterium]